jgi:Na+/proline symporter
LAGFFLTLATHSTDHDMVQRLLAARDGRRGGRVLWISALTNFPLTALFLAIGTGIAYQHSVAPPLYDVGDARQVLPLFALHELPAGVRGLVFAGLFAAAMSSLDSAICAIATTWVRDIAPRSRGDAAARMRRASVATCVALAIAALGMAGYQELLASRAQLPSLVEFALSAMSILYGGMLGVFGAGFLFRGRGSDGSALVALAVGGALGLTLFLHPILLGRTLLAWGYWIPLSAAVSAAVVAARPQRRQPQTHHAIGADAIS